MSDALNGMEKYHMIPSYLLGKGALSWVWEGLEVVWPRQCRP